jgi:hypothetical protein
MNLLRGVDQQEKQREGARCDGGALEWERFDFGEEGIERQCAGFTVAARATRLAQRLDGLEGRRPFESVNDAAERRGEPPYVVVKGSVFGTHSPR